ncbi:MAG TPA: hypothetical protein VK183_03965 [Flavobacterium sp.]|nr:hypothetical protein [Flavobacterium sp.]
MNLPIIIVVGLAAIGLVVWMIRRNAADRKVYERSENAVPTLPETEDDEDSET